MERTGKIILTRTEKTSEAGFSVFKMEEPSAAAYSTWLHPNEITYFHTLKFERRRMSYLLGRIAAKQAIITLFPLLSPTDIHIDFGVFGFPVVKCAAIANIKVSISHCDNIGIAVAYPEEHPLGIDIEMIDPEQLTAISSQLQESEKLLTTNSIADYTVLWSIKEAVSKIFMTGLTIGMELLTVKAFTFAGAYYESTFANIAQYKAISYVHKRYVCSLVLPGKTTPSLTGLKEALQVVLK
jgi:phosphopantetheinyl transferase